MTLPNASIIGCGNLAFHLSKNLENIGVNIIDIYGRDIKKARKLASKLYNAQPCDNLDFTFSKADLFFLCISDDAIQEISSTILLPQNAVLIHCSGAVSLHSISQSHKRAGVFYPIQTFTTDRKISFIEIPVCIEASLPGIEIVLEGLAKKLKAKPYFMSSEQRKVLHLSAVFACNFSNHLFSIAKLILQDQGLPFNLLHHLIAETVQKAIENDPQSVQTGPAIRRDLKTMAIHENLLNDTVEWQKLYSWFSTDINRINEIKSR